METSGPLAVLRTVEGMAGLGGVRPLHAPERAVTAPARVGVPTSYDYSPAWVTAALSRHFPEAVVGSVRMDTPDPGTTTRLRLRLSYAQGEGPRTVFVKTQGRLGHRVLLGSMGLVTPEARILASGVELP